MWGQENSAVCWALPTGKRALSGARSRNQRKQKSQRVGVGPNKKILLFGSMRELALYRAEVLRQNGYQVITAGDRTEAVAAIESGGLSAVILSYTLSSETVEEMAELLKQKWPECPLIAISQTGWIDRKIAPNAIVIADQGPPALLAALERVTRGRLQ
jgi:CheY-like chemotaxis protein